MKPENVPYIVHESVLAREERHIKRLTIALILSILLLFASNMIWLYYWNQYDYYSDETITVDGRSGSANYIGNDGVIYGQDTSKESKAQD